MPTLSVFLSATSAAALMATASIAGAQVLGGGGLTGGVGASISDSARSSATGAIRRD